MQRLKITLANDEVLHVTRKPYDQFLDGIGKTLFRQGEKKIWVTNRFIVKVETDMEGGEKHG